MTYLEALKKVYLEDIFIIKSRASRKELRVSRLVFIPLIFITAITIGGVSFDFVDLIGTSIVTLIGTIGWIWNAIAALTASIRRAHDVGKSGWFMLIPIYNIYLYTRPSEQTSNEWGDPRPHTLGNINE